MTSPERCIGCKKCVRACALEHGGVFRPEASRVQVFTWKDEAGRSSASMQCQQCADAECVKVCPTGAMRHGPAGSHLVEFDPEACIDCRLCVEACSFGCVHFDEVACEIAKCDTCSGHPKCVEACPKQAVEFLEADAAVLARKRERDELLTRGW